MLATRHYANDEGEDEREIEIVSVSYSSEFGYVLLYYVLETGD